MEKIQIGILYGVNRKYVGRKTGFWWDRGRRVANLIKKGKKKPFKKMCNMIILMLSTHIKLYAYVFMYTHFPKI